MFIVDSVGGTDIIRVYGPQSSYLDFFIAHIEPYCPTDFNFALFCVDAAGCCCEQLNLNLQAQSVCLSDESLICSDECEI